MVKKETKKNTNTIIKPAEIAMFDIGKRNELIEKIINLIEEEKMSQVESYGILEHCKMIIYTNDLMDVIHSEISNPGNDDD